VPIGPKASVRKNQAMHVIAVLALDGVMPFELSIPHRIFGSTVDDGDRPLYRVVTCSLDGAAVRSNADFAVAVDHGPEVVATADTVVIPPFGSIERPMPAEIPALVAPLLAEMKQGSRLVSLCGAAYLLAAIGRLDDRPATTHWLLTGTFRERFPRVAIDPDVLFVDDGDLLTAAGAAAGVDLCLHLVRRDHGAEVANRVARYCVVPPHREGGQRQYIAHAVPPVVETSTAEVRAWAVEHLAERLPLELLAARAHMSVRTFTRRFREETGLSPTRWLLAQRVDLARSLLETTDLSVEHIATEAGFGTAVGLRSHFQRAVGVSPSAYRRTFRAAPTGRAGTGLAVADERAPGPSPSRLRYPPGVDTVPVPGIGKVDARG
jgi:transcriptional regulator GlxA family with amidase domain